MYISWAHETELVHWQRTDTVPSNLESDLQSSFPWLLFFSLSCRADVIGSPFTAPTAFKLQSMLNYDSSNFFTVWNQGNKVKGNRPVATAMKPCISWYPGNFFFTEQLVGPKLPSRWLSVWSHLASRHSALWLCSNLITKQQRLPHTSARSGSSLQASIRGFTRGRPPRMPLIRILPVADCIRDVGPGHKSLLVMGVDKLTMNVAAEDLWHLMSI